MSRNKGGGGQDMQVSKISKIGEDGIQRKGKGNGIHRIVILPYVSLPYDDHNNN